jgi:FdhD protein
MNPEKSSLLKPEMTRAGLDPVHHCRVVDQLGKVKKVAIPGETPLTIKVDNKEIITLMTLGTNPEELALGYLRNQHLLENIEDIASVKVKWQRETVHVTTRHGKGIPDLAEKLSRVTVSSGCGQGTLFSCTVDKLYEQKLARAALRTSTIYNLSKAASAHNPLYRQAGSVHGCSLCRKDEVLFSIEDVGRHNAADAISGRMWLEDIRGDDKTFFTTGRLTSEMIMKTAFMGIPVLISRSGVTQMGLNLARDLGMIVIGRAKASKFLIFSVQERVEFDTPAPD